MAEVCHMDDCLKPTGIVMALRGLCRMHYKRWRVWGDPFFGGSKGRNVCVVDGCEKYRSGRGWCSMHYSRWKRFGDPLARLKGEVVDGKRICARCEIDLPIEQFGAKSYCRPCNAARQADRRSERPADWLDPAIERWEAACGYCEAPFLANKKRHRYCSAACAQADKHRANWAHLNARRARLREAYVESFDRREIFERDRWTCGLCGELIDKTLPWPDPWSASLDHILPIAKGGEHSRANAQASHLHCNVVKSDRLEGVAA